MLLCDGESPDGRCGESRNVEEGGEGRCVVGSEGLAIYSLVRWKTAIAESSNPFAVLATDTSP
jgi:hypothetical protein